MFQRKMATSSEGDELPGLVETDYFFSQVALLSETPMEVITTRFRVDFFIVNFTVGTGNEDTRKAAQGWKSGP